MAYETDSNLRAKTQIKASGASIAHVIPKICGKLFKYMDRSYSVGSIS